MHRITSIADFIGARYGKSALLGGLVTVIAVMRLEQPVAASWTSLVLLSMLAILFLPRQFHVRVVENVNESRVVKAIWLFPASCWRSTSSSSCCRSPLPG